VSASQLVWTATSGTMTIDAVNGNQVTMHVHAEMVPGPPWVIGPPPMGTFTLDVTVTVDNVTRN
jgi:hypothetical protein